MIRQQAEQAL